MIERLISVVELKLEDSLAKVEGLILKNLTDISQCKSSVNRIRQLVKSPILTGSCDLTSEDMFFFRRLVGSTPEKPKRRAIVMEKTAEKHNREALEVAEDAKLLAHLD